MNENTTPTKTPFDAWWEKSPQSPAANELRKLHEAAAKGFHVSESCGPDKHFQHISKFKSLDDLQAYESAWRAVMQLARDPGERK